MKKKAIPRRRLCIALLSLFFALFTSLGAKTQTQYALSVDGSSFADAGSAAGLNISGTAMTLEAWIFPTSFAPNYWEGSIVSKDAQNNTGYGLRCGGSGILSLVFAVSGNQWVDVVSASNALTLNQWQQVTGVYDGSEARLYINGVLVSSVAETRTLLNDAAYHLRIGSSPGTWSPARNFTGKIDEARVWNIARTQAAIKNDLFRQLSAVTGLVASYQMSDGSGTSLTDNSGNGNTATLTAGVTWAASPIQFAGNAVNFDGTDDFVSIPATAALNITSAITLEAWVYASKNSGTQNVISKSSLTVNNGYIFPRTDDGWSNVSGYLHVAGNWTIISAPYPSLNAWHHLALTYDGAMINLYIDGTLANSVAQTGTITVNANPLTLGNQPGYPEYFGGSADEFRVWNVARTPAQILADMNRELDPATQTGLVSYFTANQGIAGGTNTGLTTLINQSGSNNGTLTNFALSGGSSNFLMQQNSLVILPLEWLEFVATVQQEQILLQWRTANESNTRAFDIQRSADGLSWNTIGQQAAAGNSNTTSQYAFSDVQPLTGFNYYRIRQTDQDGRVGYSKLLTVYFNQHPASFIVLSNPVYDGVLRLNTKSAALLRLYNSAGTLLIQQRLPAGLSAINLNGYAKGMYWLRVGDEMKNIVLQ